MSKSIIQTEKKCFYCGSQYFLEEHHCFDGNPNRKLSEKYGLKVWLCHNCHNEPPSGVHHNKYRMAWLQDYAQQKAMDHYGWSIEEFRNIFGKNYLLEDKTND